MTKENNQHFILLSMISHHDLSDLGKKIIKTEIQSSVRSVWAIKRMKLDFSLLAILCSHTVEPCQNYGNCLLKDLEIPTPAHFLEWDCSEPIIQKWVLFDVNDWLSFACFNFLWI